MQNKHRVWDPFPLLLSFSSPLPLRFLLPRAQRARAARAGVVVTIAHPTRVWIWAPNPPSPNIIISLRG